MYLYPIKTSTTFALKLHVTCNTLGFPFYVCQGSLCLDVQDPIKHKKPNILPHVSKLNKLLNFGQTQSTMGNGGGGGGGGGGSEQQTQI